MGMGDPAAHRLSVTWRYTQERGFLAWKDGLDSTAYSNSSKGRNCLSNTFLLPVPRPKGELDWKPQGNPCSHPRFPRMTTI